MRWPRAAIDHPEEFNERIPLIWGHRGASRAEKQNSPAAFELAHRWGATGVELDIRRTADSALVIHHDADLEDGRLIIDTAVADLPDYVPTLGWLLARFPNWYINIEIKSNESETDFDPDYPVVDLLLNVLAANGSGRGDTGDVIVTSFDRAAIERLHAADANVPTGLISYDPAITGQLASIANSGHVAVMCDRNLVTTELISEATGAGLFVGAWTVNEEADMRRLADVGVHAIMTDTPDIAMSVLAR